MRRTVPLIAVLALVTSCATRTGTPRPGATTLPAEVLAFEPAASAPEPLAALSETPIRLDAFAGWYGGDEFADQRDAEDEPRKPATTYLAVADSTGCRVPESVELRRAGTDLRVVFAGGTDRAECYRQVGPVAHLAVPESELRGVRTVNGTKPVDAAGPGRLADFAALGTTPLDPAAADLADTAALRAALTAARAGEDAVRALDRPVPDGERGFAFVRSGCAETGAVLLLDHEEITADLLGGEGTDCAAPAYFLATFLVAAEHVPEQAVLTSR